MPRLPQTKDAILDKVDNSDFVPKDYKDVVQRQILEVLIDIRDNAETPTLDESSVY